MTPIERLTRAIETAGECGTCGKIAHDGYTDGCCSWPVWNVLSSISQAIVVLTELRSMASEPGVMEAGGLAHYRHGNTKMPRGIIAVGIFTAMIDRILNEGGGDA